MKNKLFFAWCILFLSLDSSAQTFQVDTLSYNGDVGKHINIVILGDGYTATQQNDFVTDATNFSDYLFSLVPYTNYKNYFNIFCIEVISNESGVTHPGTAGDCSNASPQVPTMTKDTYFGCSFDIGGTHRLIYPTKQTEVTNVLAANFPSYDQVIIISNTPYYGGAGGNLAAVATKNSNAFEVVAHEMGHSFAGLSDEYYAGDYYAGEKPNMTQETNPNLVKWKNWIGDNGIGIYQHCCGGNSASWYRPHQNCKMRYLDNPFCSVCIETTIERIHELVDAIADYTPNTNTVVSQNQYLDFDLSLIKPNPNTLKISWQLDGTTIFNNVDSIQIDQTSLSNLPHTLTATVIDTAGLLRVNNHSGMHFSTVTWTIDQTANGIDLRSKKNNFSINIYPNPSQEILNISLQSLQSKKLTIEVSSIDGRIIRQLTNNEVIDGSFTKSFNISKLASGNYFLLFKMDNIVHSKKFIKL